MSTVSPIPSWEDAYQRFSPLLFGALSRLARSGFAVSPADGQDLIHDFYVEAWHGLRERYKSDRGSVEAYVYTAFVYFARPRIVRLMRVQNHLSDPVLLEGLSALEPEPDESIESDSLKGALEHAIDSLPQALRTVLISYCYIGLSERALARKVGVSRYKLRERLIEALGRVVVLLPRPSEIAAPDWEVAVEIWREQRSVSETALVLGKTEHQTRVAYKNCVRILSQVLRQYGGSKQYSDTKRRGKMDSKTEHFGDEAVELFRAAIVSVGDDVLLQRVRQSAPEILEAIQKAEVSECEPLAGIDPVGLDHRWVARLYEALAGASAEMVAEEVDYSRSLFEASQEDMRSVGNAFELALLPGLPPQLKLFANFFSQVPRASDSTRQTLINQPDVQASRSAVEMTTFGVSPRFILIATNSVARLAERMISRGLLRPDLPLLLSVQDAELIPQFQQFKFSLASAEVEKATECSDSLAAAVLRWCIAIAQYKPLLFDGFMTKPETRFGVTLRYTGNELPDLFKRWGDISPTTLGSTVESEPIGKHALFNL